MEQRRSCLPSLVALPLLSPSPHNLLGGSEQEREAPSEAVRTAPDSTLVVPAIVASFTASPPPRLLLTPRPRPFIVGAGPVPDAVQRTAQTLGRFRTPPPSSALNVQLVFIPAFVLARRVLFPPPAPSPAVPSRRCARRALNIGVHVALVRPVTRAAPSSSSPETWTCHPGRHPGSRRRSRARARGDHHRRASFLPWLGESRARSRPPCPRRST